MLLDTKARLLTIRAFAGIAQLVEHNLAKVGVASSNLVSRSRFENRGSCPASPIFLIILHQIPKAGWQSGYAAACKAVYGGSIPPSASIFTSIGHAICPCNSID